MNVWPAEASSSEESVTSIAGEGAISFEEVFFSRPDLTKNLDWLDDLLRDPESKDGPTNYTGPTDYVVPQRIRWFKVRRYADTPSPRLENLSGLDVSGSQAQILAVVMGLRDLEEQLHRTPFKKLVAFSIRTLRKEGKIKVSRGLLDNATMQENIAKGVGMPALYGGHPSRIADKLRRDPDSYESGLDTAGLKLLLKNDPTLRQLLAFLPICEAVGHAACEANPTAGVTVEDPLDRVSFTWNPPKRRKVKSGRARSSSTSTLRSCTTTTPKWTSRSLFAGSRLE